MIFKVFWGVSLLPVVQDASSEKWPITPVSLVWRENEHFPPIVLFLNLSSAHSWFILGQNRTTNCTGKKNLLLFSPHRSLNIRLDLRKNPGSLYGSMTIRSANVLSYWQC
uniref:Secreted protein n=1 Tax=Micrurus paraensis TaxID=1970185 RepID=A0A2D4KXH8_9SAUR